MATKRKLLRGEFASYSTRRDERFTASFTVFVQKHDNPQYVRLEHPNFKTESAAMKEVNKLFDSDIDVDKAQVIEVRTVRTYHRHSFDGPDTNRCTDCWEYKS